MGQRALPAAVCFALTAIYLAAGQRMMGLFPGGGIILGWFFVPVILMLATGFTAQAICAFFVPIPWADRPYGAAPRGVRLCWRTALTLPSMLVWLLFVGNVAASVWQVGALRENLSTIAAAALAVVVVLLLFLRREHELLRDGAVAVAFVTGTNRLEESHKTITFTFTTSDGRKVAGRGRDIGYNVSGGDAVPVFYDPTHPDHHVAACGTWLEAC